MQVSNWADCVDQYHDNLAALLVAATKTQDIDDENLIILKLQAASLVQALQGRFIPGSNVWVYRPVNPADYNTVTQDFKCKIIKTRPYLNVYDLPPVNVYQSSYQDHVMWRFYSLESTDALQQNDLRTVRMTIY